MKNEMNLFTKDEFEAMYTELRKDDGLMKVLSEMQTERGINDRVAYDNADALIRMVAQYENLTDMLSQDAKKVLDEFLHESNQMGSYDRKVLLHQLSFGLKLYQDPELVEGLKTKSAAQLFSEYYAVHGEDPSITAEQLEAEVYELMGNYRISPAAMRMITKRMERTQNMLATSAALGEQGMRFKCVVAMDLYLRNKKTMTMEEAVTVACSGVDVEAAADAAAKGENFEGNTKMIIAVAAMAAMIIGLALWLTAPAVAGAVTKNTVEYAAVVAQRNLYRISDILMLSGVITSLIEEPVAAWMGKLAAKGCFARHIKDTKSVEALNHLADTMETQEKAEEKVTVTVEAEETVAAPIKHTEKQTVFA